MLRIALRNVLAHKARLTMTILAVLLGVAFVAGTLVFTDSISEAYRSSAEKSFTSVDVRLRPARSPAGPDTGRLLDHALLDRAAALPGVASAKGVVSGFTALSDKHGRMVGEGWATTGANYDARYPMLRGRPPTTRGEVAIDAQTAERTGYRVGDTVRLSVSGPALVATVTGIFTTDDGNVAAGGSLALFDTDTAQQRFAEPGRYNYVDLTAAPGTTAEQLRQRVEALLPYGVEAITATRLAAEQADDNVRDFRTLSQVLLACAGVALFVAAFLIVNTFTVLVTQRSKELALLRAVGASRRQVTRSVLIEAAVIGLTASVAGLAIGIGLGAAVRSMLSATRSTLPDGPLLVEVRTVVVVLALGVGVTVCAAWLPARRATKIPPVAAMSTLYAPATVRSLVVRNTVGAVLASVGTGLTLAAGTMADGKVTLGLGTMLLLTGVFVLTPLLSRPVIAAADPALRRFGVTGKLARQNAVRNPRRTAATASALTIGLTLIAGLNVIGASADRAVHNLAASDYVRGDYVVSMANGAALAPDAAATLRELDEVTAVSPRREIPAVVDGVPQTVVGFRSADIDKLLNLGMTEGTFGAGKTAIVDVETADGSGWHVGDSIDITWPDGIQERLELTGLYHSRFDGGVRTDLSLMDQHLDRVADTSIFVKVDGGASQARQRTLRTALGDSPAIRVKDRRELTNDITGAIGLVLNILYGMLALAVVVAVLGVVNTLAMSVHERTQEIGLLRAIGLDRSGVKRMVRQESVVISLFGGVLGVGLGIFFGWAVGRLVAALGIDTWAFVVPWGRLALVLAAAAVVGVVAAEWPARRAAKLDILAAVRTE
ncbi:ABC transporter permease [Dactylosporangium roseum]|uniref:ABC transporter permease n=1 Tax=Dactylosporangium roseum TaxID=47989 RepID=A0ABY5ZHE7_9ACTN|nr:FtsX-like permease family protein [Dactylosporangium roseum]UWZ39689.1 ABC transporter permease [Dactylosporangium roseum]